MFFHQGTIGPNIFHEDTRNCVQKDTVCLDKASSREASPYLAKWEDGWSWVLWFFVNALLIQIYSTNQRNIENTSTTNKASVRIPCCSTIRDQWSYKYHTHVPTGYQFQGTPKDPYRKSCLKELNETWPFCCFGPSFRLSDLGGA